MKIRIDVCAEPTMSRATALYNAGFALPKLSA